jgi:hypothetical protein
MGTEVQKWGTNSSFLEARIPERLGKRIVIPGRGIFLALAILALFPGGVLAAIFSYKCPKCGLIQQYDRPGIYKCPKDQWTMTPVK